MYQNVVGKASKVSAVFKMFFLYAYNLTLKTEILFWIPSLSLSKLYFIIVIIKCHKPYITQSTQCNCSQPLTANKKQGFSDFF